MAGGIHFQEPEPPNPYKGCKLLVATVKDAFSNCHACKKEKPTSSPEQEYPTSDSDYEEEVVSEIRSRAMEKLRHKSFIITDSFSWVFSPKTGELFVTPKAVKTEDDYSEEEDDYSEDEEDDGNGNDNGDDKKDDFFSVGSCFSYCSGALSKEAFVSVKTSFSRSSSLNGVELPDFHDLQRRSIIRELCHCEGWPFGLCRKAVLLPPLPKSPSESWSWRKGTRLVKMANFSR